MHSQMCVYSIKISMCLATRIKTAYIHAPWGLTGALEQRWWTWCEFRTNSSCTWRLCCRSRGTRVRCTRSRRCGTSGTSIHPSTHSTAYTDGSTRSRRSTPPYTAYLHTHTHTLTLETSDRANMDLIRGDKTLTSQRLQLKNTDTERIPNKTRQKTLKTQGWNRKLGRKKRFRRLTFFFFASCQQSVFFTLRNGARFLIKVNLKPHFMKKKKRINQWNKKSWTCKNRSNLA